MPRMRTIKPGFFANDELGALPMAARLLFAGLWCWADREGRLEDRPRRLRAEILPYDDVDAEALLAELEERGFIHRYVVEGQRCIQVSAFLAHQNPHYKELPSTLPAPPATIGCSSADDRTSSADEHAGTSPSLAGPAMGHESWVMSHGGEAHASLAAPVAVRSNGVAPHGAAAAPPEESPPAPVSVVRAGKRSAPPASGPVREMATALAAAFGASATDAERSSLVVAAKQLCGAEPPALPEEIPRLRAAYAVEFPDASCTAHALANWLGRLRAALERGLPAAGNGRRRRAAEPDLRSAAEIALRPVRTWTPSAPDPDWVPPDPTVDPRLAESRAPPMTPYLPHARPS